MDGLRGLAALAIFAFHIGYLSGANQYGRLGAITANLNIGVPVFFSISGFLLYRPFVAARRRGRGRSLRQYSAGRVLRIIPGYWVALTLAGIYPGVPGPFTGDWWRFYGFAQIYDVRTVFEGIPVAWSLCVEVTFYLALPLYAWTVRGLGRRRGAVLAEVTLLVLLGATGLVVQQHVVLFTIVATFVWFVPGMVLAIVDVAVREGGATDGRGRRELGYAWLPPTLAAGGFAVQCLLVSNPRYPTQPISYAHQVETSVLSSLIAMAVLAPVCLPFRGRAAGLRLLRSRVASFLGRISYGTYLYHLVVLTAVFKLDLANVVPGRLGVSYLVVAAPATLLLATVSWYVVERPALALKRRLVSRGTAGSPTPVRPAGNAAT